MRRQRDHVLYHTWLEYCHGYRPASWPQAHRPTDINQAADELQHLLTHALHTMQRQTA